MHFQELMQALESYWKEQDCIIMEPYDVEKEAGTMSPFTSLKASGPGPWKTVYVKPSGRPADARCRGNPNRLYQHHQLQVTLKPSPENVQNLYLRSLQMIGIDVKEHDIRFVEDNWESSTLGVWGLSWEVWLDGVEIMQFTYFQRVGSINCNLESAELTYDLERIVMYLRGMDNICNTSWDDRLKYEDIFHKAGHEHSVYSFELADVQMLKDLFDTYEKESERVIEQGLVMPAYDYVLKYSHTFNVLDTRGAISVFEWTSYVARVRDLAKKVASEYLKQREEMDSPLLKAGVDHE